MTDLFMTVLDMSLKSWYVILSVCFTRWAICLGNPPRKWCYMLWGIVLIRLLLPISVTSTISSLPDDFSQDFAEKWGNGYIGETHIYFDVTEEFDTAVEHGIPPITSHFGEQYVVTGRDGISQPKTVKSEIFPVLAQIWVLGMAVMVLWNGIALLKLRRKLQEAVPLDHQTYVSDHIGTAFVLGWFSPKIYLPANLSTQEQAHILRHERYHIHRRDHKMKLLAFLVLCIHWFNPLVWLAYVQAMRDMELSCDEAVIAELTEADKADYAQTLLSLTTGHKRIIVAPVAFGEGDTGERIHHIFQYRNPGKTITIVAVILFAISAVQLLTDPKEIKHQFGSSMYGYERIAYQEYASSDHHEHPALFCLTTDNIFWTRTDSQGWEELGAVDLYPVTADEINRMMPYRMAMEKQPPITKVTDSKILRFSDENGQHLFYLLSRHKDGSFYIAFGKSDSEFYEPEHLTIYYLYPVMSGVGEHSSHEPFYQRCLESMLDDAVDVFGTHLLDNGYQVVGFRTGVPKTDYGWAVFHVEDNMATFTGQMEQYENAAEHNNGIVFSSYPALANDTGEITDKTAYDVILIANPDIIQMDMRIHREGSGEILTSHPELEAPDMIVIPWTETAKADRVMHTFMDADGNLVPDSAEEQARMDTIRAWEEQLRADNQIWEALNRFAPGRLSYMTDLAEEYLADPTLSATADPPSGIRAITVFDGDHKIVQFDTGHITSQYSGYYYSPDDVPVPFQNADVPLTETEDGWSWQAEGDNHGTTKRIAECWFSYKANL